LIQGGEALLIDERSRLPEGVDDAAAGQAGLQASGSPPASGRSTENIRGSALHDFPVMRIAYF